MRIVVCGSRDFDDWGVVTSVLFGLSVNLPHNGPFTIIEGVCPYGGADKLAAEAAGFYGWAHEPFPPKTNTAAHFHERNRAMIDSGADLCVAFVNKPLSLSRGTDSTVSYARSKHVKTITVEVQ
jgi:hypothetical protein